MESDLLSEDWTIDFVQVVEMSMLHVLIVFVLAHLVFVRGLGDENQYLTVHGVSDLQGKFLCEPALFGDRLNNTGKFSYDLFHLSTHSTA